MYIHCELKKQSEQIDSAICQSHQTLPLTLHAANVLKKRCDGKAEAWKVEFSLTLRAIAAESRVG